MKYPELIVGYEAEGLPVEAACSKCGERMPQPDPAFPNFKDALVALTAEFQEHIKAKHPAFIPNQI